MASFRGTGSPSISAAGGDSPLCRSSQGSARTQARSARTIRSPEIVTRKSSQTHPQPVHAKCSTTWSDQSLTELIRRVSGRSGRSACRPCRRGPVALRFLGLGARLEWAAENLLPAVRHAPVNRQTERLDRGLCRRGARVGPEGRHHDVEAFVGGVPWPRRRARPARRRSRTGVWEFRRRFGSRRGRALPAQVPVAQRRRVGGTNPSQMTTAAATSEAATTRYVLTLVAAARCAGALNATGTASAAGWKGVPGEAVHTVSGAMPSARAAVSTTGASIVRR